MPKQKNHKVTTHRAKGLLIISAGILALVGLFGALTYLKKDETPTQTGDRDSIVNLGTLEYDFSGDKATKRTDAHTAQLRNYLQQEGEKSLHSCDVVYHQVTLATADETQVLLNYGCNHPMARMFAVHGADGWELISPTDQFDIFGIPLCAHVEEHTISPEIAPVCSTSTITSDADYVIR